jgi:hypothetical protein
LVTLDIGSSILLDGGSSTGTNVAGGGGTVTLSTLNQAISISGSILARGGSAQGTGTGGQGGQVTANSDSNADGIGGAITLQTSALIDVSGGAGTTGGSARNNGGITPTSATAAVVFDADMGLAATSANPEPPTATIGIVQNLGTITAAGAGTNGHGGDIIFDGFNSSSTGIPISGTVTQTGSGTGATGTFLGQ